MLDCALGAEAAHDEKVYPVVLRSLGLLQAVVDAAHQFFICNDEAYTFHSSDYSEVITVYLNLEAFRVCRLCYCTDDLAVEVAIDKFRI